MKSIHSSGSKRKASLSMVSYHLPINRSHHHCYFLLIARKSYRQYHHHLCHPDTNMIHHYWNYHLATNRSHQDKLYQEHFHIMKCCLQIQTREKVLLWPLCQWVLIIQVETFIINSTFRTYVIHCLLTNKCICIVSCTSLKTFKWCCFKHQQPINKMFQYRQRLRYH